MPTFPGVTLDTCLMWKRHLEAVEAKATRKLAIMKKLTGSTWGAIFDILKQVYTGAARPVIEYASTTLDTASKTNESDLDRVQNMGLRIIFGTMRSIPIQQNGKDRRPFNLGNADTNTKLPSKGKSWRDWPVTHSTRNFSMEQKNRALVWAVWNSCCEQRHADVCLLDRKTKKLSVVEDIQ